MTDFESNRRIDEQLRRVDIPDGLLERLRSVLGPSDDDIDVLLRAVPVPPSLCNGVTDSLEDAVLDEKLQEIPIPSSLLPRVHIIPHLRTPNRLYQFALAVASLLVVSTAFYGSLWGVLSSVIAPQLPEESTLVLAYDGPLGIESGPLETQAVVMGQVLPEVVEEEFPWHDEPNVELTSFPVTTHGPVGELLNELAGDLDLQTNTLLLKWGALGYPVSREATLPELDTVSGPLGHGIPAPLDPGYDRRFLFTKGAHPLIDVSASPRLRETSVPLWTSVETFDGVERALRAGYGIAREDVRVEDFLAAMDYRFPMPQRESLALHAKVGPSPFRGPKVALMQLGVRAGEHNATRAPTHLTLLLDASATMRWGGRWQRCAQGVGELVEHMAAADQVSVALFNEEVHWVAEQATRSDSASLQRMIEDWYAEGGTNLGQALHVAFAQAAAVQVPHQFRRQILVVTDIGETSLPHSAKLRELAREAKQLGIGLDVLDLGIVDVPPTPLDDVVSVCGGERIRVSRGDPIHWAMLKSMTGQDALVAKDAVIKIQFNPDSVQGYRIIGHECTSVGGMLAASVQSQLRGGEESTALFEVWPKGNSTDHLATVELRWVDEATNRRRVVKRRIERSDLLLSNETGAEAAAKTLQLAPPEVQVAAIAAQTAELLRRSPYVLRHHDARRILAAAKSITGPLSESLEFQRLKNILVLLSENRVRL